MRRRKSKKLIYLDHAAATPLDARVLAVMRPFLTAQFGNRSSLNQKGVEARNAVEASRRTIADVISARPEEIVFTSGGTESCNLALLGFARMNMNKKPNGHEYRPHIITTSVEHHAVLEPVKILQKQGWKITFLPVDKEGFINVDDVKKAIRKETVLVSVMYANNEIGTIEPIAEIGKIIARKNAERQRQGLESILFHTDACQAAGALDLNVSRLNVDLMSVSASKIYGPKGIGFLYVQGRAAEAHGKRKRGLHVEKSENHLLLEPLIHGGGQERGLRSGTENVAGIVGMARALELAVENQDKENKRVRGLRNHLIEKIAKQMPKVILNGSKVEKKPLSPFRDGPHAMGIRRLPNNINITIPGVEGEALMLYLDAEGICVSTGSACTTGSTDASHVLRAIGRSERQAKESIRITLGRDTKKSDLDYFMKALKQNVGFL